jgi:hypothetical protein
VTRREPLLLLALLAACNPAGAGDSDGASGSAGDSSSSGEPPEPYVPVVGNAFPWAVESTDALCRDGKDNDSNGFTDCADFACSRNPSVSVCGPEAVYEASADLCANGREDDGDGLIDCADPDCFKNPFHDVCDKPRSETRCADGVDGDGDGKIGCEDLDCAVDVVACPPAAGSLRVLFDQTLDETAGAGPNSDWVVDPWGRLPAPSNPMRSDDWAGSLSGFGFALYRAGHRIENLMPWDGRLSFNDPGNPQDLGLYDVLVLIEPSRQLRAEEKTAIIRFVLAGGGLLAVANHRSADRDSNGWSAVEAFNDMFDFNAVTKDPFGFAFDLVDLEVETPLSGVVDPDHPVIKGPAGVVATIGFFIGSTARLTGTDPKTLGLVTFDQPAQLVVGAAEAGKGRVVFMTDSAIANDGTDSHGNQNGGHDAWNDTTQDNRVLFVNAVTWLGG